MGSMHRPSDPSSGSTGATDLLQCINGQEPHIHEFWYMGLGGIIHEVHPVACVEVPAVTVGEFVTD